MIVCVIVLVYKHITITGPDEMALLSPGALNARSEPSLSRYISAQSQSDLRGRTLSYDWLFPQCPLSYSSHTPVTGSHKTIICNFNAFLEANGDCGTKKRLSDSALLSLSYI